MAKYNLQRGGDTLVLNNDGQPLSVFPLSTISWRDAVSSVFTEDFDVLETYEDWVVRSPSTSIAVPAVVMTKKYVKASRAVRFSSYNVYLRDDFTCQYCNQRFSEDELTKEHVHPKKLGGKSNWENIVAACQPCNQRKSHYLEMKPRVKPRRPSYYEMVAKIKNFPITARHQSWLPYLDWPEHLIKVTF